MSSRSSRNPLLALPGAVAGVDGAPDSGVAAHHGDPLAEQRAIDRGAAVVDRSHRELISVTGEDRLSWLHLLLTQHVSELPERSGTEALVLDHNGRVQHHAVLSHVTDTVWLDVEPGTGAALLDYLRSMVFWSRVEPRWATEELAVLSVVGPEAEVVLAAAEVTLPGQPYASVPLAGGGLVRRMPWPGQDAADLLVPRSEVLTWWRRLRSAGAAAAGMLAFEALRVEALRPRLRIDTDERTIPHEVGWIGSAVHLAKGCYRGQETVARVANLGRPPRRLVLLHLAAGDEPFPAPGDPVTLDGCTVGRVGTAALHHELGGVALALVKRSVLADAELLAGALGEGAAPATIDPDSIRADDQGEQPGRAARLRAGRLVPGSRPRTEKR
ncbi:MAG: folate-binding protein YgfZ [Pseudonocardia sp.]|nr:folate-binding protein YgfZ [Pseudonocardia sp.]